MATSVRSKMTEMFWVKMLEGQYSTVVKLFITIVSTQEYDENMSYDMPEELLRKS